MRRTSSGLVILLLLLGAFAPADSPVDFPLHRAARLGDVETLAALIAGGADVNQRDGNGATPLLLAAAAGHPRVVSRLLEAGAALPGTNAEKQDTLLHACAFGMADLARRLMAVTDLRIPRDSNGGTLMHAAAAGGHPGILDELIRRGLSLNTRDRNGWTPLHNAAARGRGTAILLLLRRGSDINARTINGRSAIHLARDNGHGVTAALLVRKGADTSPPRFPRLEGPWLGQVPPQETPRLFAPGIVSGHYALAGTVTFSPDGDMAAWRPLGPRGGTILVSRRSGDGRWLPPEALFPPGPMAAAEAPLFAPDGRLLFLFSPETDPERTIRYVSAAGAGWTAPRPLTRREDGIHPVRQFSLDQRGDLYFATAAGLFCSTLRDGEYAPPVQLVVSTPPGPACPAISLDGRTLVFSARAESGDNLDLYVTERTRQGQWTLPRALPAPVNSAAMEMAPRFGPEGKFLFFLRWHQRVHGVYWVSVTALRRKDHRD